MRSEIVNVAVIGVGSMGQQHARVYSELKEAQLVAVADADPGKREVMTERFNCLFFEDYREMLDRCKVDAISIAVPSSFHKEVALECIRRQIPILIEKPIADSLRDAQEIIGEAERYGVKILVGHIERFNPAVRELKTIVEQQLLSRIISIFARRVGVYPPRIKDANVIVDLAVHDIDICNFLLGKKPERVYTRAGKALNSKRLDYASILMYYDEVDVLIQVNWITPVKIRELHITGTKGYAELNYITQNLKIFENNYERSYDSFGDFVVKFGTPHIREIGGKAEEPLKLELSHFIQCIREGIEPVATAKDGLTALAVAMKAVESYERNTIVEIAYEK